MSTQSRTPAGVPTGGQFAASAKGESGVTLTEAPTERPTERMRRVFAVVQDLTKRNEHHSGTMLPHHSASDCSKCGVDSVVVPIRNYFMDARLNDAERIEAVEADIVEMTAENEAETHSGTMLPHQSAGDCAKCHRAGALRSLTDALEGRQRPWSAWSPR